MYRTAVVILKALCISQTQRRLSQPLSAAISRSLVWSLVNSLVNGTSVQFFVSFISVICVREILNWMSKVNLDCIGLLCHALWLVQKTHATLSTNQMKSKTNRVPAFRFFPRIFFLGSTYFLLVRLVSVLITCWDYFVYGSYALNPRALES